MSNSSPVIPSRPVPAPPPASVRNAGFGGLQSPSSSAEVSDLELVRTLAAGRKLEPVGKQQLLESTVLEEMSLPPPKLIQNHILKIAHTTLMLPAM